MTADGGTLYVIWDNQVGAAAVQGRQVACASARLDRTTRVVPISLRDRVARDRGVPRSRNPRAQQPQPAQLVITGARIFTGLRRAQARVSRVVTIVVRDGRIAEMLTDASAPPPPADRVIDAAGKTVTAGLWNCHVHFTEPKWSNAGEQPEDALDAAAPATW